MAGKSAKQLFNCNGKSLPGVVEVGVLLRRSSGRTPFEAPSPAEKTRFRLELKFTEVIMTVRTAPSPCSISLTRPSPVLGLGKKSCCFWSSRIVPRGMYDNLLVESTRISAAIGK